jgi:hypothetical protein
VKHHPVASFFVLTYAISWLAWLLALPGYRGGADTALSMIAQFGPALAVLIIVFYTGASIPGWTRQIVRWRVSPRWYVVAFGLPVVLIGVQGAVFEVLQRRTYVALLGVQNVTLLAAVVILIAVTRGLLAYDAAPERGPDEQPAGAEDRLRRSSLPAVCGRCYTPHGGRRVLDYRTGATRTLCVRSRRESKGYSFVRSHASGVVVAIDARLGPRRPLQRRPTPRRHMRNQWSNRPPLPPGV